MNNRMVKMISKIFEFLHDRVWLYRRLYWWLDSMKCGFSSLMRDGCWHKWGSHSVGENGRQSFCVKCQKQGIYSELGKYKGIAVIVSE